MKTIIITGASQGIGFSTALELANLGHQVIAVARNKEKLQKLSSSINTGKVIPIPADVSSAQGRSKIVDIASDFRIDILINNAAVLIKKPFIELTLDEWKLQFEVNFFSVVELIKMIHPFLNSPSHIVNVGSMAGFQGSKKYGGLSAYSATKSALANLTESLAAEFSKDRISVNCLSLGAVSTEMQQSAFPKLKPEVSSQEMGTFIANFAINSGSLMNGKLIPVSANNPT